MITSSLKTHLLANYPRASQYTAKHMDKMRRFYTLILVDKSQGPVPPPLPHPKETVN